MELVKEDPQMNQHTVKVMEQLAAEADSLRAEKEGLRKALAAVTPQSQTESTEQHIQIQEELELALAEREEALHKISIERDELQSELEDKTAQLDAAGQSGEGILSVTHELLEEGQRPMNARMQALKDRLGSSGGIAAGDLASRVAEMRKEKEDGGSSPSKGTAEKRSSSRSPGSSPTAGKETVRKLEEELAAVRKERDGLSAAAMGHTAVRPEGDAELLRSRVWEAVSANAESDPSRDAELLDILHRKGDDFSEMKHLLQTTMQQRAEESSMRERTALDMANRLDKFDSLLASNQHFLSQMERELSGQVA